MMLETTAEVGLHKAGYQSKETVIEQGVCDQPVRTGYGVEDGGSRNMSTAKLF